MNVYLKVKEAFEKGQGIVLSDVEVKHLFPSWGESLDDSILLDCLRSAGVDNWDGWDYAIELYNEANED